MLNTVLSAALRRLGFGGMTPKGPAPLTAAQKRFFQENGYLILPRLFSAEIVAELRAELDRLWDSRAGMERLTADMYFGHPGAGRIYFRNATDESRGLPYKLNDLHLEDTLVRDACAAAPLTAALRDLLGATPLVCNSLFFEWGSQQEAHFDTYYMPSETPNMMAASWLALDPVTQTNGPVYYYPKSHLIEPFRFSHGGIRAVLSEVKTTAAAYIDEMIARHGLKREVFLAQPGDVLIWHAQLLHGGTDILQPCERRRSLVTHYWTEVDFPDPAQRLEVGPGQWVLRKGHQVVVDEDLQAEVDAYLASMTPTAEQLAAVPETFNARGYLLRNSDVMRAGESPWRHYLAHGRHEGRSW